MILDACFEVPKLEDSILNFQILFDKRMVELKMSQHNRRTWLWSVTLEVADIALIWTLTPGNKSLYMQNVTIRKYSLLLIYLGLYLGLPTNLCIHLLIW